ncbi:hypothetical protein BKA56DRAFT_357541 [Ilyonectria sp. MPI-CAGE-AT-0026]|nr:hypothetical protein BKA56DRAFT_357541 [Ilyonectria sp. MPI-CAGE-AT-0026]
MTLSRCQLLVSSSQMLAWDVQTGEVSPVTTVPSGPNGVTCRWDATNNLLDESHVMDRVVQANKVPGTRCPTCALTGKEVWVIPGRSCGYCGTPCDNINFSH